MSYEIVQKVCQKLGCDCPVDDPLAIAQFLFDDNIRKHYWDMIGPVLGKIYRYLITFTLKPDAVDKADKAEEYVISQKDRVKLGLISMSYVREVTKAGTPHFHMAIETTLPVKRNRFQYYEKLYGSIDISRTKGQTIQEALEYISKDSVPVVLL